MISVLNLHSVVNTGWFERVINILKVSYDLIAVDTLYELYYNGDDRCKACHITIDDGDKSFYDVIFPVLKRHEVPASVYVSPLVCAEERNYWFQEIEGYREDVLRGIISDMLNVLPARTAKFSIYSLMKAMPIVYISRVIERYQEITGTPGKPSRNMTSDNLQEILDSGLITVGAHTNRHPILSNETIESSSWEILQSIRDLSDLLKTEIRYFAYPNGISKLDITCREMDILRSSGISLAFTTESRNVSRNDDPMRIPRIPISEGEHMLKTKFKLLYPEFWGTVKRLKPNGEYHERQSLMRLLYS